MKKKKTFNADPKSILHLLDQEEKNELFKKLKIDNKDELDNFSMSYLIDQVLKLRSPFVYMIDDITRMITLMEARIRGNIEYITLERENETNKLHFSSQLRNYVSTLINEDLLKNYAKQLKKRLKKLQTNADITLAEFRTSHVQRISNTGRMLSQAKPWMEGAYRRSMSNSFREYSPTDVENIEQLLHSMRGLQNLTEEKFNAGAYEISEEILGEMANLTDRFQKAHNLGVAKRSKSYPYAHPQIDDHAIRATINAMESLEELIHAISDKHEAQDSIHNFLQTALWKQRWRVYELWLMAKVFLATHQMGAKIDSMGRVADGEWKLKFTKDEEPVTKLSFGENMVNLYYQLYKKNVARGDMPDIAVELVDYGFVLILDPKHGLTFSLSGLKKVCERYAQGFTANITAVANYYQNKFEPITDLDGDGRKLVMHGVNPGATVTDDLVSMYVGTLAEQLAARNYKFRTHYVLFDISGSTRNVRTDMIKTLQQFTENSYGPVAIIPFSDNAFDLLSSSEFHKSVPDLLVSGKGGTAYANAFDCIVDLLDDRRDFELILFTDDVETAVNKFEGHRLSVVQSDLTIYCFGDGAHDFKRTGNIKIWQK